MGNSLMFIAIQGYNAFPWKKIEKSFFRDCNLSGTKLYISVSTSQKTE